MKHHYFAIIAAGYAIMFPAIPEDQLQSFYRIPQEAVSITEEQHTLFGSYRAGRIKYLSGEFTYDPDSAHPEIGWANVRAKRDHLLQATDWVILRANEQGTPVLPEWVEYRQSLRDITDQVDPFNIIWPVEPTK